MITPYSVICDFKSESPVLGTGEGQGDSFVYMSNMQVIVQLTGVVTWVCIRKQFQEFCPHCPPSTAANMSLASLGHTRKTSFHLHSKPVLCLPSGVSFLPPIEASALLLWGVGKAK